MNSDLARNSSLTLAGACCAERCGKSRKECADDARQLDRIRKARPRWL